MKTSRRTVHHVHSPMTRHCLLEPLELRKLLSTTFPNILPVGDSITESTTGHASYRYWLWNTLADAGHIVDFVGSKQPAGVADGPALYPGFDPHHDGHSSFRADNMAAGLASQGWKDFANQPQNTPDIALVQIGLNDIREGQSDTSTRDDIGAIIDALRAVNPNVTVLVAQITPATGFSVTGLNSLLPALVTSKNTAQSRVILVDQATGFSAAADTYDGIHPNESGEKKIAANWFAALAPLLPAPTAPPAGVYLDTPAVTLTSATNALGPVEYESSNGGDGTFDGQLMTIRGQTFMRGFGVHGPSELTFDLKGATYTRFRATVGVDDEVNPNGTVAFQVYVNNESTPRFSSQTLSGTSAALPVDIDITGATTLRLVTTDAGDGNAFDHANWAQARVIAAPDTPPPPTDSGEVPKAPKQLSAKYRSNRVELCWKDASKNETGFLVLRAIRGSSTWQEIASLGANTRSFKDTNLTAGARYSYRVVAFNDEGNSRHSNTANVNVPPLPKEKKDKKDKKDKDKNDNHGHNAKQALVELLQRVVKAIKKAVRR